MIDKHNYSLPQSCHFFNNYILEFRKKTGIKKTITMVGTVTLKEEV